MRPTEPYPLKPDKHTFVCLSISELPCAKICTLFVGTGRKMCFSMY